MSEPTTAPFPLADVPEQSLVERIGPALQNGTLTVFDLVREAHALGPREPARAAAMLAGVLRHGPIEERFWLQALSRAISDAGPLSVSEVVTALDAVSELAPNGPEAMRERILSALSGAGRDRDVAVFATMSADLPGLSARFWYLALRACLRLGQTSGALQAARGVAIAPIENVSHLLTAGAVLLRNGLADEVLAMIELNPALAQDERTAALRADALLRRGGAEEAALAELQRAAAFDPDDLRTIDTEARLLLSLDRADQAVAAYERVPEARLNTSMRIRKGQALEQAGRIAEAMAILRAVLDETPDNTALRRRLVGLYERSGQADEARALHMAGLSLRAQSLQGDLADGVARILASDDPAAIPAERMAWLERALEERGVRPETDWKRHARQLARIDGLILDWAQARPERVDELYDLVEPEPEARRILDKALAQGKGALVTSAHVGLLFSGPLVLSKTGLPFAYVASLPDLGQPGMTDSLISTSTNDTAAVGRKILRALRENRPVAIAIDGAGAPGQTERLLFDRPIRLSDFAARLAWRIGTPTLFPCITFEQGRASFRLDPMPSPAPGEIEPLFVARWLDAYVAGLGRFLLDHPEAMRGTGGFWSRIMHVAGGGVQPRQAQINQLDR
ncbi:tetratricopeptide repeat protein [Rhodovulum tesquicola]|uniref:Tetratricopeptide repeat protein n=1 Tax=Rhodovulum steppense TaxID=540251 RepID=A0A4R1YWZ8_9RHOB|nr:MULTISPECIES: tetratricopeptide repeat protein [Rhodovulum]MCO8146826.1 tetratricopeptide repeat protein [Rhodovulum tesquicola]TCM85517.1 tetratricopeptide repeat protein [Rhodovulum steppense]